MMQTPAGLLTYHVGLGPVAAPDTGGGQDAPGNEVAGGEVAASLAPGGTLRVAINLGNPVLAQRDPVGGEPRGVSVALAREVGRRLGLPLRITTFNGAGAVTDAGRRGEWDIAFLAIDPVRAEGITFSPPYVVIEGVYAVAEDSPLRSVDEVDRAGVRVSVGRGSAYDLFLTRTLRQAEILRVGTSAEALQGFGSGALEVVAGVRQPVAAYVNSHPGLRLIPGRFMVIEQAVALPLGRDVAAHWVRNFVEEAKASGFVARALRDSGQGDAEVAPPA
ncbi:ABC transporter substrate-binding protein [Roseomonas elaeocarpi]|uniref:ABC transporter substrate-binding protein n=1 Tax=Roseomonas elaeocarpi TaxID=907779 RepID=A0ABV6JVG9_9PROT